MNCYYYMYALVDFVQFSIGIASIVLFAVFNLYYLFSVSIAWLCLYPIFNEVIYNCFAQYSERVVYSGPWESRIVYSEDYNLSFCGIEKCHPFDSHKYGNVYRQLIDKRIISKVVVPSKVPRSLLIERVSKWLLLKVCYTIPICKYI